MNPSRRGAVGRWVRNPVVLLGVMVTGYVLVSFWLSVLRLLEFATSNWDLGVFQQALWSTAHGRLVFDAGDYETSGAGSFLQIHPSLIMFLLTPLYNLLPSPITLFAVQSLVVGFSALPLYVIGRRVIGRPGPALALAGFYLVSTPLLTATLFDFHLESFLPLEIFLLYLLWIDGRYAFGLLVAIVTLGTIEVAPFLVAALALVFVIPPLGPLWRSLRRDPGAGSRFAGLSADARRWFRRTGVRWSLALLSAAVLAYPILRVVQWYVVPWAVGVPTGPVHVGTVTQITSNGIPIGLQFTTLALVKARYWIALVGLLAFLPLLAPRQLLLVLPWFFFTVQSPLQAWVSIGYQYSFIPMAGLPIAAIYGYRNLETRWLPGLRRFAARRRGVPTLPSADSAVGQWTRPGPNGGRRPRHRVAYLGISAVVLVNVLIGPLNPLNQSLTNGLSGYNIEYRPPGGYSEANAMAGLIPSGAPVIASSDLFPLIADDDQAYSLSWTTRVNLTLPFAPDQLPQWAFVAGAQFQPVPPWLEGELSNGTAYGLRAITWDSPAGAVALWKAGYTGEYATLGALPPTSYRLGNSSLSPDLTGHRAIVAGSPSRLSVVSNGSSSAPFLLTSPERLIAGEWAVELLVSGTPAAGPTSENGTAFFVQGTAFGNPALPIHAVPASDLAGGGWAEVSTAVNLTTPTIAFTLAATLAPESGWTLAIGEVEYRWLGPAPD